MIKPTVGSNVRLFLQTPDGDDVEGVAIVTRISSDGQFANLAVTVNMSVFTKDIDWNEIDGFTISSQN